MEVLTVGLRSSVSSELGCPQNRAAPWDLWPVALISQDFSPPGAVREASAGSPEASIFHGPGSSLDRAQPPSPQPQQGDRRLGALPCQMKPRPRAPSA